MTAHEIPLTPSGRSGEGVRSVLSLRSVEEEEKGTLPPPQKAGDNSIGTTLLALGVFILAPARMRAVAVALAGAGVTSEQLQDLAQFIAETEEDEGKQRKYLASVLLDSERTMEALRNVAAHRTAKAAKADDGPAHMVNMPIGTAACPCSACRLYRASVSVEPWDHDRQSMVAACLVVSDKWSLKRLSDFFGISETTAGLMVERGMVLRRSAYLDSLGVAPRLKKGAMVDDAEQRAAKFRGAPRSQRLRLLTEGMRERKEAQG